MITELGKKCQEMARIGDFSSFKSQLLDPSPKFLSVFASFKKESSYVHVHACNLYSVHFTLVIFIPGTPVSSTNTTDSHDITKILLKVALNIFYF